MSKYKELYEAVKLLHSDKSGQFSQQETNKIWSELKKNSKNDVELHNSTSEKVKTIKEEALRKKSLYTSFFVRVSKINETHVLFVFIFHAE